MRGARTGACVLALAGTVALAGCGNAVSSHTPLSTLGKKMSVPASTTTQMVRDTIQGKEKVQDDGTKDRSCGGGHRRVFRATVTAPRETSEGNPAIRNRLSLVAQAGLKPAGVKVTTDLGKSASSVPSAIDFANHPSDAAQKRTYTTTTKLDKDSITWTITGQTACIKD